MERITTASRIIDLFGPPNGVGRDGFGDIPPDKTEVSAIFLNNLQEELANAVEAQGIVLDGLTLDQLKQAIDIWSTFTAIAIENGGTFTLKDSSTLVVEADGGNGGSTISVAGALAILSGGVLAVLSGGTVDVQSGSMIDVKSGATLEAEIGSTVDLLGSVTIGTTGADVLTVDAAALINENVNFAPGKLVTHIGSILTSDNAATIAWNGTATFNSQLIAPSRFTLTAGSNIGVGDISVSGDDLRHQDSSGTDFIHKTPGGWFKGHNQVNIAVSVAVFTLDTQAVAPKAAADVDIDATLQIQRAIAGDVRVSIDEVGGAGQVGTSRDYAAPVTGTTTYLHLTFSRTRVAADTTPRAYRVTVDGLGSDVNLGGARIVATPAVG